MAEDSLILRMRAQGARSAAREVDATGRAIRRTGDSADYAGRRARAAGSGFAQMNRRMSVLGRGMRDVGGTLTRGLSLPLLGAGFAAGKLSISFDKAMRNVNSLAQLPEKSLASLQNRVLALAGPTAQAPQTLAEGLYDLVSSGFDVSESMHILEASARAATAGLTTTEVSTRIVAAVLNAYRRPASDAAAVSDSLFKIVDRGVISFGELADNLGPILPTATTLGVKLNEVGATIATMTKAGIPVPETMTAINSAMTGLIKPTVDLQKAYETLGVKGAQDLIRKFGGFQGAIEAVIGTTDGSTEAIGRLFGNVRAQRTVFAITGKSVKAARADLKMFGDTSGSTSRALSQQSKSISFRWNEMLSRLKALGIEIGNEFLPAMGEVIKYLGKGTKWFKGLSPETRKWVVIIGLAVGVLGPLLSMLGIMVLTIGALASPVALTIIGVAALAAGFAYLYVKFKWFRDIVGVVWELLKHSPIAYQIKGWIWAFKTLFGVIKSMPSVIKSVFTSVVNFMIDRVNTVIKTINHLIDAFNFLPGPDIGKVGLIGHIGEGGSGKPVGVPFAPGPPLGPQIGRQLPSPGARAERLGPPAPQHRGPRRVRRNPLMPTLGGMPAAASSTGDTILESHITLEVDGKPVAKKVHRESLKKKATS